jgi:hypothetical protein
MNVAPLGKKEKVCLANFTSSFLAAFHCKAIFLKGRELFELLVLQGWKQNFCKNLRHGIADLSC